MTMNEEALKELTSSDISTLPLATVDTQAPLVIDLPDGQKLVVGHLDPGTVIEVATWRGTGRPDSRTNRLMLGVSESAKEVPEFERTGVKGLIKYKDSKPKLREVSLETDVEELVNQSDSMRYTTSNTVNEELQRQQVRPPRFSTKSVIKALTITIVIVLVFVGLIGPGKLRFAHPQSGVETSLGSIENSLVIVRQGVAGKVGDPVLVDVSDSKISPVVAIVTAVQGDNYLLNTSAEQLQSSTRNIHGKVQFVIPYLGFFASLVGK